MTSDVLDRFLRYVRIHTTSQEDIDKIPSTKRQFDLAHLLVTELQALGLTDASVDDHCYVIATLPSNLSQDLTDKVPTLCLLAHMDTSPEEPVTYNYTQCIACKSCLLACPFGVIEIHPYEAVPMKCDLCSDRRSKGVIPACAEACPTGAITFLTSEDVTTQRRRNSATNISDSLLRLTTPPVVKKKL